MDLFYRPGELSGTEIGEIVGVDYSTVSLERKRLREKWKSDKHLSQSIKKVKAELSTVKMDAPLIPFLPPHPVAPRLPHFWNSGNTTCLRADMHRQAGSHKIFTKDGIIERINLQSEGSKAKGYQVRQIRKILTTYKFNIGKNNE